MPSPPMLLIIKRPPDNFIFMKKYIMSIDQGTTGSTVIIFDEKAKALGKGYSEFKQIYPQQGWVEQDPKAILKSVDTAIQEAFKNCKVKPTEILAIGITNQRETVLSWNPDTNKPNYNAIVWQCRRTSAFTDNLKKDKAKSLSIFKKTGLVVDPYFSSSKMNWLIKNDFHGSNDLFGTVDTFLIWNMTGGKSYVTDVTNASRTQLMNLQTLYWDDELLKLFKVKKSSLPEIVSSNAMLGETKKFSLLPDGIPIHAAIGDQQAALFGQGAIEAGEAKCTFGTGSFILMNIGRKFISSHNKMLTTVAWQLEGQKPIYAFEGGAFICGAAVQYLRDQLSFFKSSSEVESLALKSKLDSEVLCVPAYSGLGAPYWDPNVKAAYMRLTRGDGAPEICYATLVSLAMQNTVILECMQKESGKKIKKINVDGGAAANDLLMQMQSDTSNMEVVRPNFVEVTSLGAALMAGLGLGLWTESEIKKILLRNLKIKFFKPKKSSSWVKLKRSLWDKAIQAVKIVN